MAQGNFSFPNQSLRINSHSSDMDLFDDYSGGFDEYSASTYQAPYSSSPAVPTMYDQTSMARTNSSQSNVGTVSPQDLMVRDPMSAPNSTAFTNLTSPSMYNESPDFDGYDVSPMFGHNDLDPAISADPWFPLFPDASGAPAVDHSSIDQSPLQPAEELEVAEQLRGNRRRSGTSPGSNKASTAAGVAARKRSQPLPPIVVDDPNDTIAIKRARNTLAARKSREKKMQRFDELEGEIAKLREERDHWKQLALQRSSGQP